MRAQTIPGTISTKTPQTAPIAPGKAQARPMELPKTTKYYGYARISSQEKNEEEQLLALRSAGVPEEAIYMDAFAGGETENSEYEAMLQNIKKGDVLIIKSLDKLGRCYDEIIAQWQTLTKVKHADVVVLDIPLLDTRVKSGDIDHTFMADLVLQFMAYVALRERESIRQRQHEGILAAQQRGVRFGRPPKPIPPQFDTLLQQWKNKEISSRKAAQQLGVAQETFLRWSRKREQ